MLVLFLGFRTFSALPDSLLNNVNIVWILQKIQFFDIIVLNHHVHIFMLEFFFIREPDF